MDNTQNPNPNNESAPKTFEEISGGMSREDLFGLMTDMRNLAEKGISGGQGVYIGDVPHYVRPGNMQNGGFNQEITIETFDKDPRESDSNVLQRTTISALGKNHFDIIYQDLTPGVVLEGKSTTPIQAPESADVEEKLWFIPVEHWAALRLVKGIVATEKQAAKQAAQASKHSRRGSFVGRILSKL